MGDVLKWAAEQEDIAEEKRHKKECKERLEKVDPVALNDAINILIKCLNKQQLTKQAFEFTEDLRRLGLERKHETSDYTRLCFHHSG